MSDYEINKIDGLKLFLLQVPFDMAIILSLYFFLSLTLCIISVFSFCNHILKLSRCLTCCLSLLFFSTELPRCNDVMIILSLLMTNLKNLACLSLILTQTFFKSLLLLALQTIYDHYTKDMF